MLTLLTRPFSDAEAEQVADWHYPPPFDIYNTDPDKAERFVVRTASGEGYYPAVQQDGAIAGFCVFGAEARVHGQEPAPGTLDVGIGIRPDLVGQGLASQLIPAIIALAESTWDPAVLRTAVATFNTRSLALCRKAGFDRTRHFAGPAGRPFVELTRPCTGSTG